MAACAQMVSRPGEEALGRPGVDERLDRDQCVRFDVELRGQEVAQVDAAAVHLGWYSKGLPGAKRLRQELFQATTLAEVETLLEGYLEAHLAERVPG